MAKVIITLFLLFIPLFAVAKRELGSHPAITSWRKFEVPQGFVLYTYLVKDSGCYDDDIEYVWDYHAYAFKKKNPTIVDINSLDVGSVINLQTCKNKKRKAILPLPVKVEQKNPVVVIEENKKEIITPSSSSVDSVIASDDSIDWFSDSKISMGLGVLSESRNSYISTGAALTFRMESDIHPKLSHRLMTDFMSSVIYIRNKIDFKTAPAKYQFFVSAGIGNRVGLQRNIDPKVSTNLTNYAEASVGVELKFVKSLSIVMEFGSALSSNSPLDFSVTALKKLGKCEYSLGAYFDYVGTDSSVLESDTNSRRFLTSGIIFSY